MNTTSRYASVLFSLVGMTFGCGGEIGTMPGTDSLASAQAPPCVAPPANMMGWWPAEGDAKDMLGANNGTIQAVTFAPGEVGQGFSSGGNGGQVSIATPNFETPSTGFTVETWINPTSLGLCSTNSCKTVVHRERAVGSRTWWIGIDGSSIHVLLFLAQPNSGRVDVSSGAFVTTGSFQHIAASYDGNTVTLYYNGSLVATQVVGAANFNIGDPINIGIENLTANGSYDSFAGSIDELAVYNRALSGLEIAAIYGAGTSGKCHPGSGGGGITPDGGVSGGGVDADDQDEENYTGHSGGHHDNDRDRHDHRHDDGDHHDGHHDDGHHDDGHHDDGDHRNSHHHNGHYED